MLVFVVFYQKMQVSGLVHVSEIDRNVYIISCE